MKFILNKKSNKKKSLPDGRQGLTMIELLIAVAIFVVVVSIIFSIFLTGLKGYKKAIAVQNIQDNARYLLSFIAKEVRMSDINSANDSNLDITRHDGQNIVYNFDGANIQRIVTGDPIVSGSINSEEVTVSGRFDVSGIGDEDPPEQPRITIMIKVETIEGEKAEIIVQTTLSPRNLEI